MDQKRTGQLWHTSDVNKNGAAPDERIAGVILVLCTLMAVLWANSPWAHSYGAVWTTPVSADVVHLRLATSARMVINNGFMVLFFLALGLGIMREVRTGVLNAPRRAALPIAAAMGGVVVPALLYLALTAGTPGAGGWGIPMATDPAFALGLLALVGRGLPTALRAILAALAVVDDIVAVLVIAVVYHAGIRWGAVGAGALIVLLVIVAERGGVRRWSVYLVLGVALWLAFLAAGVSPPLAGVALAATLPMGMGTRLERTVAPWVAFLIVPLFALANAGVTLAGMRVTAATVPVLLGVAIGLVVGKQVGITLGAWLAVRAGIAVLPPGVRWWHIYGLGWLGGLGFTTALFIAGLALDTPMLLVAAKLGILVAAVGAAAGSGILLLFGARLAAPE